MSSGNWGDLRTRVLSAIVMLGIGAGAIATGGLAYVALITLAVAGMNWELSRMIVPDKAWLAIVVGIASAAVLVASVFAAPRPLIEAAIVPGLIGALFATKDRVICGDFRPWIAHAL